MRRKLAALAIAGVISSASAQAEDAPPGEYIDQTGGYAGVFLCVADAAGGVAQNRSTGEWSGTIFDVIGEGLTLSIKAQGKAARTTFNGERETGMSYEVKIAQNGDTEARSCSQVAVDGVGLVWIGKSGMFKCSTSITDYWFNLKDMRFQKTYTYGFVDGGGDTPSIVIGNCSLF